MVTYVKGDLFKSPAKVLVNTVNTVGVMGKGIAKTFKTVYPDMFKRYQQLCETRQLVVGKLWIYKTQHKWILNFPTKVHWRQPSKPEYIEAGLQKFVATYAQCGITSIAFPQLGCGNGELSWATTVRPLMERYLNPLTIDVFIYKYDAQFGAEHRATSEMIDWLHSEPQSLAFSTFWEDCRELIGEGLELTESSGETFKVAVVNEKDLLIKLRNKSLLERLSTRLHNLMPGHRPRIFDQDRVLIPQECMLDLWQAIRGYGFCTARVMPEGLDALAPYLIALLGKLSYFRPVELSRRKQNAQELTEPGLQLYAPPTTAPEHLPFLAQRA